MKQAIISTALELIGGVYSDSSGAFIYDGGIMFSCPALKDAIAHYYDVSLQPFKLLSDSILKEYREFSGALESATGFKGIALSPDPAQRQTYRQEMLYYFWMANQEM